MDTTFILQRYIITNRKKLFQENNSPIFVSVKLTRSGKRILKRDRSERKHVSPAVFQMRSEEISAVDLESALDSRARAS